MHELAPLIFDLAIMLGLASIVTVLFQRIHQPVVLGYLVAGMIVGPHTPPYALVSDIPNIKILSELGVIFLMFSLGLEFSFQKLMRVGFSAGVTGVIEVVLMVVAGYGVGRLIGWTHYDSLFLGAALSISSTTIIIKAIDELKLKTRRFAELVFGILIVEDLLAILLLVALSTIVATNKVLSFDILIASVQLILVVGAWFLFGYFLIPPLFRRIEQYVSQETLTIVSVALCLELVCVAALFHYSVALGAFIMGSILAETDVAHRIEELIRPIRDIFAAVFFISVGMLIDPVVIFHYWYLVLLLSLVTILLKIIIISSTSLATGQSFNTSVRVGFGMAQIGEFSFIIAGLGLTLKVTSDTLYPLIVAVAVITTFTTPYLIRLSANIATKAEGKLSNRTRFLINKYSAWVYRTQTISKNQAMYQKARIRLIINGIMVAIIFTLLDQVILPRINYFVNETSWTNTVSFMVALTLASPFIWGMIFSYNSVVKSGYVKLSMNSVNFIVWLIAFSEIAILGFVLFQSLTTILFFIIIAVLCFVLGYQKLENSYKWFENHLVDNIHMEKTEDALASEEELAPWDMHLVEIEISEKSSLVGRTVGDIHARKNYGVNLVAITRDSYFISAPGENEKMMAYDKLVVLGHDEQIDFFRQQAEVFEYKKVKVNYLDAFKLRSILLESDHPLIGKTIASSNIRDLVNGLVVGLERDGKRIVNPPSDTVLQADDLLLIVGEMEKISKLNVGSVY